MSLAGIVPGYLIGYLVAEDEVSCEYRTLPVISLIATGAGEIEPIVMLPTGQTARASDAGVRAFAVGPGEDAYKIALAHAAGRTIRALRGAA